MTSHEGHDHPNTSSARAKCRKAAAAETTKMPRMTEAKKRKARAKAEEIIDTAVKSKKDELNEKRLRATQAMAAMNKPKRGTCYVCGGPAGWIDNKTGEQVCLKHVDFDDCKILAL